MGLARAFAPAAGLGLDSDAVRNRMVQKLVASGISSPQVLQAMGVVERHRFVDSALVNQAYEDTSLPIGLGQTISKPSVVARMTELLLQAEAARAGLGRVLEIGTGCGYQAAVLATMVREVYSIERLRGLHEKARSNLRPLRLANVHLILGDGMQGYPSGAPYAGIIAAAGGESVPDAWCDQLAIGADRQLGGEVVVVRERNGLRGRRTARRHRDSAACRGGPRGGPAAATPAALTAPRATSGVSCGLARPACLVVRSSINPERNRS